MKKFVKARTKKRTALLLASTLVTSTIIPSYGNPISFQGEELIDNTNSVLNNSYVTQYTTNSALVIGSELMPELNINYSYDFAKKPEDFSIPTDGNKIGTVTSTDGFVTVDGKGSMYYKDNQHGVAVADGNTFQVKVAGNAVITFKLCQYGSGGTITAETDASGGKFYPEGGIDLKVVADGGEVAYVYKGEPAVLTFTINGSGYLHGFTVRNTTEDVTPWIEKDFSISIGNTNLIATGATTEAGKASVAVDKGEVYYAQSKKAYVSIDLGNEVLSEDLLTNNSPDVVESLHIDGNGDVVVTFIDKETYPHTYNIKVQDTSQFQKPTITDVFSVDYTKEANIADFTNTNPINDFYTVNNGMLSIRRGISSKAPYWKDQSHGLYLYTGNEISVVVAGDAEITFAVCMYGKPYGILNEPDLPEGANGSFVSGENHMQSSACGNTITYHYTGPATTLRFVLASSDNTSTGENYLHSTTVKNTGELTGSTVVNPQEAMPNEVNKDDTFSVIPVGHRLMFGHDNTSASINNMTNVGYYLFDATTDFSSLEADIKITAVGNSTNYGVYTGLFESEKNITQLVTLGIRGGGSVRNIYNKTPNNTIGAGGINSQYAVGDTIHVKVQRTPEGFYSEMTTKEGTTSALVKNSNAELLKVEGGSVRFGFAFANVNGVINNLTYTTEAGKVLYKQTDCYEAVGTPPVVNTVKDPVLSEDRTKLTVTWTGDNCADDGAYQVELSKDGGNHFEVLSNQVTEKTYTAEIDGDGTYVFRISGVCGENTTPALESLSITVQAPLESPVLTADSGDTQINLSWTAINEATQYQVYRKASEETEYQLIKTVEGLTYQDVAVKNEEPYYYYVVAQSNNNESNPSNILLMVPTAGRQGEYVYENEATNIFITKKSYDTVYKNEATLEGVVDNKGTLALEVNNSVHASINLNKNEAFAFKAPLIEGRNDVNLLFTDEEGKVTRKTFNFVYLTHYDLVVNESYTGIDGEVASDGTNTKMYRTLQAAVDSIPLNNTKRVVILVKEGNYREYLRIASPYITLIGEDREKVNINFFDKDITKPGGDTDKRCAIHVKSSATGFSAENLTFENTYEYLGDGSISNESADAIRIDAKESTFVNVKLLGYQDTLQANSSQQYFYKCYIAGNIDYIYGNGQALFNDCELAFRYNATKNSGYITAPKTDPKVDYGYIFNNCVITAEEGCNGSKYLLARPWGADASVTFINTYMGSIINKVAPYADMSPNSYKEARFSEYYSYGPSYAINSDRPQISKSQAETMLTPAYLGWNPYDVSEKVSMDHFVGSITTLGEEKFIEADYTNDNADPDATDDTGLGAFNLEGYAQRVTGGGTLLESSNRYYQVATAAEFLEALSTIKKTGKASVIELTQDINLGSKEIGDALNKYSSIIKPVNNQPLLHPTLLETGISTLYIKDMSNLTIYSKNGSAIKHTCIDISNSSNIIIRNIVFDELWEWDEATAGDYDRNDWDYMTIQNGSTNIWIDHCTFYKAYDGVVDIKKAISSQTTDVTISWSKFLPESESRFFDEMLDLLEANPEAYPYYNELITHYDMTKEQVRAYAAAQKKTHLVGASDTEAYTENLQLTLANNYYKNSMDRMPRLRGGNSHVYNCILDASEILELKNSIENPEAALKVVSNGAISTCGASVLLENTSINGIINALASGNGNSPGGYINAVNSLYYLNGELTDLAVTDNAGAGMILNAEEFISKLPYKDHKLYDVNQLNAKVLPKVGAGVINMSSVQWQKTTYNDPSTGEDLVKEYDVTFDYQGATANNTITTMKVTLGKAYGELPTPERSGYTFLGWYTQLSGGQKVTPNTIVTQEQEHTLYARWSKQDSGSGDSSSGGSTTKPEKPEVEEVKPEGTDKEEVLDTNFNDISGHWATESIAYVINKGILKGVSEESFAPNAPMTRSMFATVLYRLVGEPEVIGNNTFVDVKSEAWYEKAIIWASKQGIVSGIGAQMFDPNGTVTREQIATMLYNYITAMGIDITKETQTVAFTDQKEVSPWAKDAMTLMGELGIISGDENKKCNPKAQATRAEVSAMIHRFMKLVEEQK